MWTHPTPTSPSPCNICYSLSHWTPIIITTQCPMSHYNRWGSLMITSQIPSQRYETPTHLFSFSPIDFPETGRVLGQCGRRNGTSCNGGLLPRHRMLLVHTVDAGDWSCPATRSWRRRCETVGSWRGENGFGGRQRRWSSAGRCCCTAVVIVRRGTAHICIFGLWDSSSLCILYTLADSFSPSWGSPLDGYSEINHWFIPYRDSLQLYNIRCCRWGCLASGTGLIWSYGGALCIACWTL